MAEADGLNDIVSTRVFGAAPDELFRAFSDPARLSEWWGPSGFTNEFETFEFRPGGAWRFTMRGPDGAEYSMAKRFLEVIPSERIVLRHDQGSHSFVMTIELAPEGAGTRLTWRMRFDSADEAERVRDVILVANEQNLDRLQEHLAGS
jgi:uncharacterized protein YndB with AHSA1/START domain